jgi:DNA-3-methyladenine glycosylase II
MTTPDYWQDACRDLSKRCVVMRALIKQHPTARKRSRGNAFQTLARSIVGQQISVKAAQSVWDRVADAVGTVAPPQFLGMSDEALRACGLSRGKVVYLKDLARHFDEKLVNPRRWLSMTDDEVVDDLVRIKGVGRWSAEMFLIFHLWRPDVFPVADIGVIRAIEKHFHDRERLSKPELEAYRARWAPWSTVATWYLWRSLEANPVEY